MYLHLIMHCVLCFGCYMLYTQTSQLACHGMSIGVFNSVSTEGGGSTLHARKCGSVQHGVKILGLAPPWNDYYL